MMKAMVLNKVGELPGNPEPLDLSEMEIPAPGDHEILIRVEACGVCRTELDQVEGRLRSVKYPVIPGHQVAGIVEKTGKSVRRFSVGDPAAVGWIFSACGKCEFCRKGLENLCAEFKGTGLDADGGYAEYMTAGEDFACRIPASLAPGEDSKEMLSVAPLICAGAIGYRSVKLSGIGGNDSLGLSGFGSSGSLVLKMVKKIHPGVKIFVFTRSESEQRFALELGADWAGPIGCCCPEKLSAVIDTTPVWTPVLKAMEMLKPSGRLVINAIRKENTDREILTALDYPRHLWMEKEIKSAANVTRADIEECLALAAAASIRPVIQSYRLPEANNALLELKKGGIRGSKVLDLRP